MKRIKVVQDRVKLQVSLKTVFKFRGLSKRGNY